MVREAIAPPGGGAGDTPPFRPGPILLAGLGLSLAGFLVGLACAVANWPFPRASPDVEGGFLTCATAGAMLALRDPEVLVGGDSRDRVRRRIDELGTQHP